MEASIKFIKSKIYSRAIKRVTIYIVCKKYRLFQKFNYKIAKILPLIEQNVYILKKN